MNTWQLTWGPLSFLPPACHAQARCCVQVGHVPFTHAGSVSKRSSADVITLDVLESSAAGFKGINKKGPRKGQLGAQDTEFRGPCLMRHTINAQDTKVSQRLQHCRHTSHPKLFANSPL